MNYGSSFGTKSFVVSPCWTRSTCSGSRTLDRLNDAFGRLLDDHMSHVDVTQPVLAYPPHRAVSRTPTIKLFVESLLLVF